MKTKQKKALAFLLCAALVLALCPAALAEGEEAPQTTGPWKIGEKQYSTFAAAVADVPNNTATTIELTEDTTCGGAVVKNGQNITVELHDNTFNVSGPTVGSTGTETNGFQLLKGSTVVFQNGTVYATNECKAQLFIQNYCNLTLKDVTVNVSGCNSVTHVVSNNNGSLTVTGSTDLLTSGSQKAFDVYYWSESYPEGVTVNVNTTGMIQGDIEYDHDGVLNDVLEKAKLNIQSGTFTGSVTTIVEHASIIVNGGTFNADNQASFVPYVPAGNTLVPNENGEYTLGVADNAVAEVGGKGYTSLVDAIEAAKNGGTVKLRNAASDVTIPAGTSVTIDLNGQTISSNADHAITNNGTLTIIGSGTVDGKDTSGKGALYNAPGATANLNGGTFTGSKWYVIKNLGTMTIDGASVVQNDIISSAIDSGYFGNLTNDCGVTYPSSATVTLNITSGSVTGGVNCVKNDDFGILNISGGSFSTTAPDGAVIMNWNKATISGGTFVGDGTAAVISNGYLSDTADKGELTITNGTFTSTNNGKLFGTGSTTAGAKTTISGGTFTGQLNKISTTTVSISGGTYSVEVPDEFCAPGYHPEELENGRYGVSDTYHTGTTGSGLVSGGIVIGTGTNTGTVTDPSLLPPQTGDASVVGIAAALLLLASCGMAGLALRRSAKKREMN